MWWVAEGVRYQLRHVSVILQFQEYFEAAENIAHSDHYKLFAKREGFHAEIGAVGGESLLLHVDQGI